MADPPVSQELQDILLEIAESIGHRELISKIGNMAEKDTRKEDISSAKKP